jgi:RNA polymerase sigma-70 factor (ECF subfamily)
VSLEDEADLVRLMAAAQDGDRVAYDQLLRRLAGVARRYVRRRVGPASWVEDVVQECLLTLHRVRHTYDPTRPLAPWWYAIVQSRLVDALRHHQRVTAREVEAPADWPGPPTTPAQEQAVLAGEIRRAVSELPSAQRRVIELLKFEDMSVRDVASELGMSESNVKVTAHRGYQLLRRRVQEWIRAH